jgi:hypothetical protein
MCRHGSRLIHPASNPRRKALEPVSIAGKRRLNCARV